MRGLKYLELTKFASLLESKPLILQRVQFDI